MNLRGYSRSLFIPTAALVALLAFVSALADNHQYQSACRDIDFDDTTSQLGLQSPGFLLEMQDWMVDLRSAARVEYVKRGWGELPQPTTGRLTYQEWLALKKRAKKEESEGPLSVHSRLEKRIEDLEGRSINADIVINDLVARTRDAAQWHYENNASDAVEAAVKMLAAELQRERPGLSAELAADIARLATVEYLSVLAGEALQRMQVNLDRYACLWLYNREIDRFLLPDETDLPGKVEAVVSARDHYQDFPPFIQSGDDICLEPVRVIMRDAIARAEAAEQAFRGIAALLQDLVNLREWYERPFSNEPILVAWNGAGGSGVTGQYTDFADDLESQIFVMQEALAPLESMDVDCDPNDEEFDEITNYVQIFNIGASEALNVLTSAASTLAAGGSLNATLLGGTSTFRSRLQGWIDAYREQGREAAQRVKDLRNEADDVRQMP